MTEITSGLICNGISNVTYSGDVVRFIMLTGDDTLRNAYASFAELRKSSPVAQVQGESGITESHSMRLYQATALMKEISRQEALYFARSNPSKALEIIYRHTHKDFKGVLPCGAKSILLFEGLVALEDLSSEEISYRIPIALQKERARKKSSSLIVMP